MSSTQQTSSSEPLSIKFDESNIDSTNSTTNLNTNNTKPFDFDQNSKVFRQLILISSRMMEIKDQCIKEVDSKTSLKSQQSLSNASCSQCEIPDDEIHPCRICRQIFCHRCVHYFMLPKQFLLDSDVSDTPVPVCQKCYDQCIERMLSVIPDAFLFAARSRVRVRGSNGTSIPYKQRLLGTNADTVTNNGINKGIAKGSSTDRLDQEGHMQSGVVESNGGGGRRRKSSNEELGVLLPPDSLAANTSISSCLICDKNVSLKNCSICGELFCENCVVGISRLPKLFRFIVKSKKFYKICFECWFRMQDGRYSFGRGSIILAQIKIELLKTYRNKAYNYRDEIYDQILVRQDVPLYKSAQQCEFCNDFSGKVVLHHCRVCGLTPCVLCCEQFYLPEPFGFNYNETATVCQRCHSNALKNRSKFYPYLPSIRYRRNKRIRGTASKPVIWPPKNQTTIESFQKKIASVSSGGPSGGPSAASGIASGSSINQPIVCFFCFSSIRKPSQQNCRVCGEFFCKSCLCHASLPKAFETKNMTDTDRQDTLVCRECRFLIVAEKYELQPKKRSDSQSNIGQQRIKKMAPLRLETCAGQGLDNNFMNALNVGQASDDNDTDEHRRKTVPARRQVPLLKKKVNKPLMDDKPKGTGRNRAATISYSESISANNIPEPILETSKETKPAILTEPKVLDSIVEHEEKPESKEVFETSETVKIEPTSSTKSSSIEKTEVLNNNESVAENQSRTSPTHSDTQKDLPVDTKTKKSSPEVKNVRKKGKGARSNRSKGRIKRKSKKTSGKSTQFF